MPAKSRDQQIAAKIAEKIKSGEQRPKPGTASASMAESMSEEQIEHFTHREKGKKK